MLVPDDESDISNRKFMFMSHDFAEWFLLPVHFSIQKKYIGAYSRVNVLFVVDEFVWFVKRFVVPECWSYEFGTTTRFCPWY